MLTDSNSTFSFSIANTMSLIDTNNTFEWKIKHDDNDSDCFRSDSFTTDGNSFFLHAVRHFYSCSTQHAITLWKFFLHTDDAAFFQSSYTFSIVDREGQDYIAIKSKIMKKVQKYLLMTLDYDGLSKGDIVHKDSLTVRFTWNCELDAGEIPCVIKDEEPANLLEILLNDFSNIYKSKMNTDCILKVNDAKFQIHPAVLSTCSSMFSTMFHNDTFESRSGEVNILDVKMTALSNVLYYIYSGCIRGLTADTALSMCNVADKFDLLELRRKCLEYLEHNLTMDNFLEAVVRCYTHDEMDLEEIIVSFFVKKLPDVFENTVWQKFVKDYNLLAIKLLTSVVKEGFGKRKRNIISK